MIFGLEAYYQPKGEWTPVEAVAVVSYLDENGVRSLFVTSTPDLTGWERLGMLIAATDISRDAVRTGFVDGDDV